MSRQTLGGQRLGSGNKMQVDLHGFERSSHDMSYIWRSTMASGTLVPFLKELALPGDTFDIHLNMDGKTHPTVGPLFGSYKVQLDVFAIPIRLYHSALHNNKLGIGMNMASIKLPKIELMAPTLSPYITGSDIDNAQINPSSIWSYLGIRGVSVVPETEAATAPVYRKFNAVPYLAYWDIYKNYYANKQEEEGVVIHQEIALVETVTTMSANGTNITQAPGVVNVPVYQNSLIEVNYVGAPPDPDTIMLTMNFGGEVITLSDALITVQDNGVALYGIWNNPKYGLKNIRYWDYATPAQLMGGAPKLSRFPLSNIDDMREAILQSPSTSEFVVNAALLNPYDWANQIIDWDGADYATQQSTQEGLAIKTYQSDLFNNWLSTEWIDGAGGINEITAVDTSGGSFNIDTLNLSKKVYDMLNRIAVSGGSYDDWLEAVYDHESHGRAETPVYLGGLIKELTFQEVVSNSESSGTEGNQPLGTLAGKGVMSNKHKGGTVVAKVNEPSYIMGIISLTPRLDYSQGNKWDVTLDTLDDLHKPNLDEIGFQELITEQMAWWSTNKTPSSPAFQGFNQKSAGKQPAWINYMTNVNEVRGNFAIQGNEMFMTLNRRYEATKIDANEWDITDLTTYIDPTKFNQIFAQTSIDAQNFWVQISVDMTARRKMSAKVMPNL